MALIDLLLIGWILLLVVSGFFRGLVAQVLSLAGVVVGIALGAWIAPRVLPGDSDWSPLASIVGAAIGAFVAGLATGHLAAVAHGVLSRTPVLHLVNRVGGAFAGGLLALALAWVAAVLFLHQPSIGLRRAVQGSAILPALVRAFPPEPLLQALKRFDPLPVLELGPGRLPEPDPSVVRSPAANRAKASVVRVEGTSCGLGVRGSGWVLRAGLVATNAHVVSGQTDTRVLVPDEGMKDAAIVYLDAGDDVALLRVEGLGARPLRPRRGGDFPRPVVLMGYPGGGALVATPGTAGDERTVVAPDAYGRGFGSRSVVPLRGRVRRGESGGPVIDRRGRVVAMIFGASRAGNGGFGIPVETVVRAASGRLRQVDPGPCVG